VAPCVLQLARRRRAGQRRHHEIYPHRKDIHFCGSCDSAGFWWRTWRARKFRLQLREQHKS
jgi:hypothetical protein